MQKQGSAAQLLDDGPQLEVPAVAMLMLVITSFIDTLAGSISTPVMPFYAKAFNISTANIGWLYGAWSFSSTIFAPKLTQLADKIGRRPVLIMSLVGAGTANLVQGAALQLGSWGFEVFLFGRFFSGIWAAVGATINVYVTDVCPPEVRAGYFAKLSVVPLIALLFGPGLGGGLSKLGLNVPVVVDGAITLFCAGLVAYYLPETPSFLRSRQVAQPTGEAKEPEKKATPVPRAVYLLGFAQFLGGIGFSTLLSTLAIFMLQRYDFDALRTGFTMMGGSIVMVGVNVWGVPCASRHLSMARCIVLGGVVNGTGMICFALSSQLEASLLATVLIFAGNALRGATSTTYVGSFTDDTNRGSVFAVAQRAMNLGRMVGPILATHIADWYGVGVPFLMAGIIAFCSAAITLLVEAGHKRQEETLKKPPVLKRGETQFNEEWIDEVGSKEDVESLGRFVADLLSKRHYQWVSKRSDVERLLEHVLPELDTLDRDAYRQSKELSFSLFGKPY